MAGLRGFVRSNYVSDTGQTFSLLVDDFYASDLSRGWTASGSNPPAPLPRGWLPRVVLGVDASGRTQRTRIGTTTASLWTGATTTFQIEATDGTLQTCTVIGRMAERNR